MNPTIIKLPKSVQSIICASNQINSYTKAVQELVFNSLDAEATSIAVRIYIPDGSIQVVDNGFGISQADFKYIGQKYMTSKIVDISTLKSAPNKYGFQGQSLANLAQISETLKVTSRFYKYETTYVKEIENGRPKLTAKCSPRPSKGTTIEIKGFLYNLNIQKKSVNLINELQSIKTFLEHISLIHSSISLSLRDDSKNEIVYKIHKNRDMYQTLYTLYEIEKANVQELQVEKNQYKVKVYVGKHDIEIDRRLIFLNGKFIDSSPLYKKLNDKFKKHLKADKNKIKKNAINDEENHTFANKIPFYILFITCPYMDYELTNTVLEFKDWGKINMLLDKLVTFFTGDVNLKIVPKNQITGLNNKHETEITRNHIENIMRKILGSHQNKPEVSKMPNGIKGKMIKRKTKKKISLDLSKIVHSKQNYDKQRGSKQSSSDMIMNHEQTAIKDYSKIPSKPGKVKSGRKHVSPTASSKTHVEKANRIRTENKTCREHATACNIKIRKKIRGNYHIITKTKQIDKQRMQKKVCLNNKFEMETESVKRRCELLAQKTKAFIKNNKINPQVLLNENVNYTRSNIIKNNQNIAIHRKVNEIIIHEYIPLPPKLNIDIQVRKNQNKKSFISNYDLLQTIMSSQEFGREKQKVDMIAHSIPAIVEPNKVIAPFQTETLDHNSRLSFRILNDPNPCIVNTPGHNLRPFIRESSFVSLSSDQNVGEFNASTPFEVVTPENNHRKSGDLFLAITHDRMSNRLVRKSDDISPLHAETLHSNNMPYKTSDDASSFQPVTFQSHNYIDPDFRGESEVEINNFLKKSRTFITTQSRENFGMQTNVPVNNRFKKNKINLWSKLLHSYNNKINFNKSLNKSEKMFVMNNFVKGIQESYTIEFTECNKCEYTSAKNNDNRNDLANTITSESLNTMTPSMNYIFNDSRFERKSAKDSKNWLSLKNNCEKNNDLDYEPINGKTFTITDSYRDSNIQISFNHESWNNDETYTIDRIESGNTLCCGNEMINFMKDTENNANSNTNFVFISKSQQNVDESQILYPINVCETILKDQELSIDKEKEFNISFNCRQDSCDNVNVNNIDVEGFFYPQNESHDTMNVYFPITVTNEKYVQKTQNKFEEISHHFTIPNSNKFELRQSPILVSNANVDLHEQNKDATTFYDTTIENNEAGAFNLRNRLFFVPKGMSPIFEGRQTKPNFNYDPEEDYYEEIIYNNFVEKVQNDAEVFKPRIRETSDLTTKDISKANTKMNKDNASLKFDGLSIKNANVLGQVDSKYIAATMKGKCNKSDVIEDFLVLFDQHAVHERIRLEKNLVDYLTGSQWKSVIIDEVSLKMSRDNILYLHNYSDKFTQFGLEWTILNYDEISITAIPEGILGKNPRQVDKIIKAVKSLITEEINMIQMQRGCVSLYPKSIMDLIFSEACRYAIKFGDKLSKSQCVELLNELSDCKTPFQCAHGRPAIAVIMSIESCKADYKISFDMLKQFKNLY